MDIWATMESKTEGTMRKSIENWVENWCQKIVYILLGVIILKNKQWLVGRVSFEAYYPTKNTKTLFQSFSLFGTVMQISLD